MAAAEERLRAEIEPRAQQPVDVGHARAHARTAVVGVGAERDGLIGAGNVGGAGRTAHGARATRTVGESSSGSMTASLGSTRLAGTVSRTRLKHLWRLP